MFVFGLLFVGGATAAALLPLRLGKWVPSSGAIGQILLLAFFTVTVGIYAAEHGVHGITVTALAPTPAVFIAIAPVLLYSFVGVELPTTAAEEMHNPRRDIPVAIARAGIAQALMYGIPITAVLVVLAAGQISSLHGLIDAMRTVFTVYGGHIDAAGSVTLTGAGSVIGAAAAVLFVWVLLASGAAWIMGAGRAQAAACQDGAGPVALGRISPRSGVPVRMALVSGVVSLLAMTANLLATGGDGQKYFSAALTVSIALIVLAYLLIYPAFLVLRQRYPLLERPFRLPGGWWFAWLATALATGWSLLVAFCLLWPGFGTAAPDDHLPEGFAGQRLQFEILVLAPLLTVIGAWAGYFSWSRARASRASSSEPSVVSGTAS